MKILTRLVAVVVAAALPPVVLAQTNYLAQEIVPAEATGQMGSAALNNNGEAAFTYFGSSNRVELWLPQARNGLPVGSTKVASVADFSIKLTDSLRWAFSFSGSRYYWDGVLHQLPLYPGMTQTYLNDLNENGTMVGQSVNLNSPNTKYLVDYTAAHVINGGLFSDFWEILPGSGPTETYYPTRINKMGDIAGSHSTDVFNGDVWQHRLSGAFLRRNGVVHHIPPAGPAIGEQWTVYDLNEKGQVVVLRQPPAGSGQPQQFYLYLPVVDYGWPSAGLIGPVTEYSQRYPRLNNQGQISGLMWVGATNYAPLIWNRSVWLDIRTLPIVQPGFAALRALHINDRGQILCRGTVPGKPGEHPMLLTPSPGLFATFLFPTNRLSLGDELDFTVRVVNGTLETLNDVRIVSLEKDSGAGGLERVSGPTPGNPVSLPRGGFVEQQYRYRATNGGSFVFAANLEGRRTNNTLLTARSLSDPLKIIIRGDLLIKRAAESASRYAMDNEYQSNPSGQQVRTNLATITDPAEFQVKIENDDPQPRTFVLKATDHGTNAWDMKYLFNNQDIAAQLAASGFTLPQLASNASHTITVRMTPTNAPGGDQRRALLQLESSTEPGMILDIVEAVTDFAAEIIVNSTGNQPDASLTDTVPDVDLLKPGVQTTLRCAIDFANRREGADVIKFEIPATDPDYRGGIPRIRPATALPIINTPVIIDGWSQNPNSLTPPVEISGENANLAGVVRPAGLEIFDTQGCELRGLAIFGFVTVGLNSTDPAAKRADGILLNSASECRVVGCHLGIDGPGRVAKGNDGYGLKAILQSDLNVIGGLTPQEGNLISGNGLGGIAVFGSKFNFVLHNRIGLDAAGLPLGNGSKALFDIIQAPSDPDEPDPVIEIELAGILVVNATGTQLEDNRIAAQRGVGVLLGQNYHTRDEARRNIIGKESVNDSDAFGCVGPGVMLIGTNAIAIDNRIIGNQSYGVETSSSGEGHYIGGNFVVGNKKDGIRFSGNNGEVSGNRIDGNGDAGILVVYNTNSRIGSDGAGFRYPNIIVNHPGAGIWVDEGFNLTIVGNFIGVEDDGKTWKQNRYGVVVGTGHDNEIGGPSIGGWDENTICSDDEGILITYVRNRVSLNRFLGISSVKPIDLTDGSLVADGTDINDTGDADLGGNTKLNHPDIISAVVDGAGIATIEISLAYVTTLGKHWISIYQEDWDASVLEPIATFPQTLWGQGTVSLTLFSGLQLGKPIALTLTDSGGNTSEMTYGPNVQSSTDDDQDAMSDGVEALAPHQGDGNHDGTGDAQQANVTSFPALGGRWITLVARADVTLGNVQPVGTPAPAGLPAGYTFPFGVVAVTISGLNIGGTVSLTNILHNSASPTTVFAYGPNSLNPQPHWYELSSASAGEELRLTFADGATGDHDQTTNGSITTMYAPAYLIPPGPVLTLSNSTTSPTPVLDIIEVNGQLTLTTNLAPLRTTVLNWPATATNYYVQTAVGLAPTNLWRSLPNPPVVVGNQMVVTNTSLDSMRFYRLRSSTPLR